MRLTAKTHIISPSAASVEPPSKHSLHFFIEQVHQFPPLVSIRMPDAPCLSVFPLVFQHWVTTTTFFDCPMYLICLCTGSRCRRVLQFHQLCHIFPFSPYSIATLIHRPSGSGKTSLLAVMGGRSTARSTGSITFNGEAPNKKIKRKMGFVAQVCCGIVQLNGT